MNIDINMGMKSLKNRQIYGILKEGKIIRGRLLNIFYKKGEELKISFLITKKTKNAVTKNRLRRKLREAWRRSSMQKPNVHICVMTKTVNYNVKVNELLLEFQLLLKQIK